MKGWEPRKVLTLFIYLIHNVMPRRTNNSDTARMSFNKLSLNDKAMLVINYAHFVHTSTVERYAVNLYQLDCLYIETWYNRHSRQLEWVEMPSYKNLDMHIENIDINFRKLFQ